MIVAFEKRDPIAAGEAVFDHVTAARGRLLLRMARRPARRSGWPRQARSDVPALGRDQFAVRVKYGAIETGSGMTATIFI